MTLGTRLDCLPPPGRSRCLLGLEFALLFRLQFELQSGFWFGCCCSWRSSGSPHCTAPASCEASRLSLCCLVELSLCSFLTSSVRAASPTLAVPCTFAVMSAKPAPHNTLSLCRSFHVVSTSSRHSFMPHRCTSPRGT